MSGGYGLSSIDWAALVQAGLGAAAFVMAKKLSLTVQLLTDLVRGHDRILESHHQRITRVEVASNVKEPKESKKESSKDGRVVAVAS